MRREREYFPKLKFPRGENSVAASLLSSSSPSLLSPDTPSHIPPRTHPRSDHTLAQPAPPCRSLARIAPRLFRESLAGGPPAAKYWVRCTPGSWESQGTTARRRGGETRGRRS